VLVVDEAHHLTLDLLEELRLLGNLEGGGGKALQVILIAQESLLESLARPEMGALSQRLVVRVSLEPLGVEEAVDYLQHHVRVAGGRPEALFDDTAMEILARGSRGLPRLLNQAAHQALTLAYQAELSRVDAEAALEALGRMGLEAEVPEPDAGPTAPVLAKGASEVHHEDAEDDEAGGAVCRLFSLPRNPA
jgi:general secretion pathway protein A